MPSKAKKLLEQMRNSKSNWKRTDLDKLYEGFGFVISHGGSHDIVKHPDFPRLRTSLPRHRILAKGYVEFAVKLVDRLLEFQKESEG
jgi:predicted RNA binding protein YcfA (HicA-like mRNA interferase family)